jgi:CRISPR/Cas system-associated endonuclease Cas1
MTTLWLNKMVFHSAQSEKSKPLVYDLMELFRAPLIDKEVLVYLHRKKKPLTLPLSSYEIRKFIKQINMQLEHKVYLREFKQCHSYGYCIELQILRYIHAVNHKKIFVPMHVPKRHESRCS